jgi:hypothetical protein
VRDGARIPDRLRSPAGRRGAAALLAALVVILAAAGLVRSAGGDATSEARLQQQFHEAGRAYDAGRLPDAVRLYEDLVGKGYASVELFYNLGNASFKGERLGPAVLNYRRAWRLAPRDPDVAANLGFALQAAGVPEPELSGAESLFTRLSGREWVIAATAGWWATWLLLGLAVLLRARRGLFLRLAAVLGVATVVALFGVRTWRAFDRAPEAVVMEGAQQALHAPLPAATPHFPVPEGSVVRLREQQGDWVRVVVGGRTGWLRRSVCTPVPVGPSPDRGGTRP